MDVVVEFHEYFDLKHKTFNEYLYTGSSCIAMIFWDNEDTCLGFLAFEVSCFLLKVKRRNAWVSRYNSITSEGFFQSCIVRFLCGVGRMRDS
jgi:hypothetical protein